MTRDQLIFGTALAIAIPLLIAWLKLRLWDLQAQRKEDE